MILPHLERTCLFVLLCFALTACTPATASVSQPTTLPNEPLLVAAAADLRFAFTEIADLYMQQTGQKVTLTFGSTGLLAQQIENGAPFDLMAAANITVIDDLETKGLILPDSRQLYAQGRIVLAVNKNFGVQVKALADLARPEVKRISIANPEHAPYGLAAQQALQTIGLWEQVKSKVVFGENVSQALQYIQTGDAPVGIVSLSVANVPEITWSLIDSQLHAPLNQALAVMKRSPRAQVARAFIAFVNGPQGRPIMKKYGFLLPGEF